MLVSDIIVYIRSKGNGFIKKDRTTGKWVDAGNLIAREKVGQLFRNTLSNQYKSAFKVKRRRRISAANRLAGKLFEVVISNKKVSREMAKLSKVAQQDSLSDSKLFNAFTRINLSILEHIKEDKNLFLKYQGAMMTNTTVIDSDEDSVDSADGTNEANS